MGDLFQKKTKKKRDFQYSLLILDVVSQIKNIENLKRVYRYAEALLTSEGEQTVTPLASQALNETNRVLES